MDEKQKQLLDEREEMVVYLYNKLDKDLRGNPGDLTRIPTSGELISASQTIINNLGKDFRTERMMEDEKEKPKLTKEEILKELDNLQHGKVSYPIEIEEHENLIIVNKTVQSMDRDLWETVNQKVKGLGGHWFKPNYRWEIRL